MALAEPQEIPQLTPGHRVVEAGRHRPGRRAVHRRHAHPKAPAPGKGVLQVVMQRRRADVRPDDGHPVRQQSVHGPDPHTAPLAPADERLKVIVRQRRELAQRHFNKIKAQSLCLGQV